MVTYSLLAANQVMSLIFDGVFDRFPGLRLGLVEQRAGWIPEHLRELDSALLDPRRDYSYKPDRMPSDYWNDNCFVGCSFMAHFEAEQRREARTRELANDSKDLLRALSPQEIGNGCVQADFLGDCRSHARPYRNDCRRQDLNLHGVVNPTRT